MADTTHNVTIKATLDTSQIGIPSNGLAQPSSSGGGSGSTSSGMSMLGAAVAKAGAGMTKFNDDIKNASTNMTKAGTSMTNASNAITKTIILFRTAFEAITYSLSELNKRIQLISWMYKNTHSTLDTNNKEFKFLTGRATALQHISNDVIEKFKAIIDNLYRETQ